MHICIFSTRGITGNIRHWGGVHTHVKNLTDLLIDKGHAVSLITGTGVPLVEGRLNIIPVGDDLDARPDAVWYRKARAAFLSVHSNLPIDCIFSEGWAVQGFINKINDMDIPVLALCHLLNFHYFYNIWQEVDDWRSLRSYVFRTLPRIFYDMIRMDVLFLRKCEKIVTGSVTIARQVEKYYRINKNKIEVFHNWVDTDLFSYNELSRKETRQSMSIKKGQIAIIIMGALWRPKGFRVALRAFDDLLTQLPDALLIISGTGPDREYMENYLAQRKNIKKRIKLTGHYVHNELPRLLSACDIFVIPSLMNEVLPYTLLEAMACRIPIIASDIAANREALGPSGSFFPRRDAAALTQKLLEFAGNLLLKRADAARYRYRVEKLFSKKMAVNKLDYLLKETAPP